MNSKLTATFNARAEAVRLTCQVDTAMTSNCELARSDLQLQVHRWNESELNELASELEKRFYFRWITPYARVIRNEQKIKGLRFYPGFLDVVNFGKTLFIQTFALKLSGNS